MKGCRTPMRQFFLEQWCFQSRKQESRPSKISPQLTGRIQKFNGFCKNCDVRCLLSSYRKNDPNSKNNWERLMWLPCKCIYIYTHAYIYILYALYKPVTPSPHEIHIATEVKKRIDKQLRHNLSVSPEPRLRYQRKQSPFFGANSGTVRVFSTTIQVVCVFCRS